MTDTDIYMFAGKGGVGKTTCAATTALHLAGTGGKTIAISTDATPSLRHIFEIKDTSQKAEVKPGLFIQEIGQAEVRQMWDRKFGREVYAVFASFVDVSYDAFAEFMSSMLPGLADEFMVDYIRELKEQGEYQSIIWDTAPLGQTLALLETPALLVDHLRLAPGIYSRLRLGYGNSSSIMDILKGWQKLSADTVAFLAQKVTVNLVTSAEALAFDQMEGIQAELQKFNFRIGRLIVNNVIKAPDSAFLREKAAGQKVFLEALHRRFGTLGIIELPMLPHDIRGLDRLREIEASLYRE